MRHLSLAVRVVPAVAVVVLAACADRSSAPAPPVDVAPPPPPANGVDAQSFSRWTPSRFDTCTREQHDAYSAIGPDGKRYPTWHPPVDPSTGCRFGHEHGADPSTSPLFRTSGPILFGYANEKLFETDPANARDEDHVGHKIEVLTGMRMRRLVALDQFADAGITCDLLMKMHQGTHSADAFGNNVHEVHWYQRCSDGSEIRWNYLAAIGNPSEIMRQCTRDVIRTVPASPVNSPQGAGNARALPSSTCEAQLRVAAGARSDTLLLKEDWAGINFISAGPGVVMFDPYFDVANPSRLHTATHELRRTIDLCRGSDARRMRSAACDEVLQHPDMTWDDPRSPFNGARRQLVVNTLVIDNRGGPTTWYTDPYGRRYSPTPFPGSIRQYVAAIANNWNGIGGPPAVMRDYGRPGTGVHAPN